MIVCTIKRVGEKLVQLTMTMVLKLIKGIFFFLYKDIESWGESGRS